MGVLALLSAFTLGVAAHAWPDRLRPRGAPRPAAQAAEGVGAAWRGAGEIVRGTGAWGAGGRLVRGAGRRALDAAVARPGRVLAIAALVAVAGWGLQTWTRVESDVQKLVPQRLSALRDLRDLQRISGGGGEVMPAAAGILLLAGAASGVGASPGEAASNEGAAAACTGAASVRCTAWKTN